MQAKKGEGGRGYTGGDALTVLITQILICVSQIRTTVLFALTLWRTQPELTSYQDFHQHTNDFRETLG